MKAVDILIWAMALGLPLLGGFFLVRFLANFAQARRSLSWPVVTGLVTDETRAGRVSYRYTVDGKHYVSHKIHVGDGARAGAADLDDELAAGHHAPMGRIDVYHDPDRPHLCVLRPGVHAAVFYDLALGLVIGGIGIALLVFLLSHLLGASIFQPA